MDRPLPHADRATIASEKLRDYVLSPTHPIGRFKAAFFAHLGYTQGEWPVLERDLRDQHLTLPAAPGETTPFGRKYRIAGPLRGPAGRAGMVVSVWIVRQGEEHPRLVTLFPAGV